MFYLLKEETLEMHYRLSIIIIGVAYIDSKFIPYNKCNNNNIQKLKTDFAY